MRNVVMVLMLAGSVGLMAPATAQASGDWCTDAPRDRWVSFEQAAKSVRKAGYDVRKVEREGTCYEVYAVKGGRLYNIYVNPASGRIVKVELDDD